MAQYPHQMSGGERQRLLIAMATAHRPKLLIADEPVSALDAALRKEVMALLTRLCRQDGMAMLLVSHDLAGIEAHADRLLLLENGRVAEAGMACDVALSPTSDYERRLMAATPRLSEPLTALPEPSEPLLNAQGIAQLFMRLQRQRRLSLLFITHDLAMARRIAHRIAVMENGRIVETASRDALAEATKRLIAASE